MMKKLFFFLFLISCASPNLDSNAQYETLIFDDNLTFDEFNNLLIIYAEQNTYPNIDK
tara:strand:+ start:534 stop:707 length:174 start_codon:yes stop_codon:yes gene_type:complete